MIPLPVLAETGEGATRVLAIFAGIALVGIAATFATTRFYARLQRHRWVAAFTAGGWFAMITGIVIGPRVLAVLDAEGTQALQPLLYIALAWIGLIVGLQLRRPLLAAIPAELARWIRLDTIVSLLVGTAVAIGWWRIMAPEAAFGTILLPALALAVAFIGWAPETRSLRPDLTPRSGELAQLVQAGGGLGAAIAVLIFGLGNQFVRIDPDGPIVIEPWLGLVELFLSAGVAIMLGTGARLLLRRTSGAAQESLVITLSLVLIGAGFAAELGLSPLLNGLIAGGVIANLRDPHLRDLERGLQSAEPAMAVLMLVACGSVIGGIDVGEAVVLGLVVAILRLVVKPLVARHSVGPGFPDLPPRDPLFLGPARMPLVAIAVAIGPAIVTQDAASETVLGAVMLATLLSAVSPGLAGRRSRAELPASPIQGEIKS